MQPHAGPLVADEVFLTTSVGLRWSAATDQALFQRSHHPTRGSAQPLHPLGDSGSSCPCQSRIRMPIRALTKTKTKLTTRHRPSRQAGPLLERVKQKEARPFQPNTNSTKISPARITGHLPRRAQGSRVPHDVSPEDLLRGPEGPGGPHVGQASTPVAALRVNWARTAKGRIPNVRAGRIK